MATVNRPTALVLSIVLHAAFFFTGLIVLPWGRKEPVHVTPITLVTAAEAAPLRAAEEAPEPQEAQVEKPEPAPAKEQPQPPKPPVPQPPAPQPKPPKAEPAPKPKPSPVSKTAPKSKPIDLNDLARTLAQASPPTPAPKAAARAGPTQAERDAQARQAEGELRAATASALQAIAAKIADNWNVPCGNPDERRVVVLLRIELGVNGGLLAVKPEGYARVEDITDPRIRAAAFSAQAAARAAAPFNGLPEQTYSDWRSKTYEFRASEVCADRMRSR